MNFLPPYEEWDQAEQNEFDKVALGADPALLKKLEEAKERQGWT